MKNKFLFLVIFFLILLSQLSFAKSVQADMIMPFVMRPYITQQGNIQKLFLDMQYFESFIAALITTQIIESIIALLYLKIKKITANLVVAVILANFITLPMIWYVLPFLFSFFRDLWWLSMIIGEVLAVVFEAHFIRLRGVQLISLKQAYILSILMNIFSVIFGGILGIFVFLAILRLS